MKNKIVGSFLIGILLMTAGCAKVPKLANGQEVFAQVKDYKISADDLYKELKEKGGLSVMLDMIDKYIVSKEITDTTSAENYAQIQVESYKSYYGDQFESTLKNYGYQSIEAFKEVIKNDYLKQEVAKNYIKKHLTDEEINSYYDNNIYGDLTVKYILVKPTEPESDATDEDKLKLEEEALNEAKEIIKKYNNGEKFEDLAKEYSDDKLTKENGGLMSNFNTDQVNESFFKVAVALKDGELTKEPIKDENGYNIILRVSQKEKAPLKDVKEEILTKLAEEKIADEENAMIKAWLEIRKEYNLEIIDTDAKTLYKANYDNM